jgi:hypothetical protein
MKSFGLCLKHLVTALALFGCATSTEKMQLMGKDCGLQVAPNSALTTTLHGTTLFAYPAKLELGYSGCHSIWAMSGTAVEWKIEVLYVKGTPVLFASKKYAGSLVRETRCRYQAGQLTDRADVAGGAEQSCPSFDSFVKPER